MKGTFPSGGSSALPHPPNRPTHTQRQGARGQVQSYQRQIMDSRRCFVLRFGVIKDGTGVEDNPANACFAVLVFCTILWAKCAHNTLGPPFCHLVVRPAEIVQSRGYTGKFVLSSSLLFSLTPSPDMSFRPSFHPPLRLHRSFGPLQNQLLIVTRVPATAGTKPSQVSLAFMGMSCFASVWISWVSSLPRAPISTPHLTSLDLPAHGLHANVFFSFARLPSSVAAPALCFTLIRARVRTTTLFTPV